jgi:hypothetical protein
MHSFFFVSAALGHLRHDKFPARAIEGETCAIGGIEIDLRNRNAFVGREHNRIGAASGGDVKIYLVAGGRSYSALPRGIIGKLPPLQRTSPECTHKAFASKHSKNNRLMFIFLSLAKAT